MKKTTIILFFSIFMSAVIFANSPYKNEVFVKGSEINMQKYVKFCKANTKIKDLKAYEPVSRCDEYSTEVLKAAGILPKDWPFPETTRVSAYWTKLASKLKDSPEEGWNVMLMRSVDSSGKEIGLAPHMAVIYVNTDGSISVAHYTKGTERFSSGWTLGGLENDGSDSRGGFKYDSFGYYSVGRK